jgi:hypothetical protein
MTYHRLKRAETGSLEALLGVLKTKEDRSVEGD